MQTASNQQRHDDQPCGPVSKPENGMGNKGIVWRTATTLGLYRGRKPVSASSVTCGIKDVRNATQAMPSLVSRTVLTLSRTAATRISRPILECRILFTRACDASRRSSSDPEQTTPLLQALSLLLATWD